jgi:hypothetical protein
MSQVEALATQEKGNHPMTIAAAILIAMASF